IQASTGGHEADALLDGLGLLGDTEAVDDDVAGAGLDILVTIDEVTGLGLYAELEAQAEEAEFESVRDALLKLAGSLGLGASERRSYLELLQG
ncbi:MAG TPA: hypothetical protein VM510_10115, partial [Caulifigura sp.]|nr:hypothetical protein [Caulifigura sp.]